MLVELEILGLVALAAFVMNRPDEGRELAPQWIKSGKELAASWLQPLIMRRPLSAVTNLWLDICIPIFNDLYIDLGQAGRI